MFYLTSKIHVNRINTFGFMEGGGAFEAPHPPPQAQELQKSPGRIGLSFDSFARNPKIGVFDRVLARGHEMGERDEEEVARPGEKGNGERERERRNSIVAPFSHFTTARQNSIKNPDFRIIWRRNRKRCFAV